jgi:O-antigen/teichoic acid export membrane protein
MEVKKRLVLLNVITSGGQVVFIGLVYFLLYRYLLSKLGVELLGVWSVVLSASSLANLANFGVADSVIRFVALYSAEGDKNKMQQLIFTASLFLCGLFLLIALIIFPFADIILRFVLPAKYLKDALLILPYSLACLVINGVNGVYASVLDGMQKHYIRTIIFSLSSLLLLVGAYLLVPRFNLQGVAFAQVMQSLFTLIFCSICVVIQTKYNPFKWHWSKPVFKQIFSYGMKFQFISLAAMLNEPITKILLGKFGGMAFVGYYEMANRLIMQARGVIVSGTQSLVPVMVNLSKNVKDVQVFYKKIFSNVVFFALTAMCIIVLGGHLISFYWIGHVQPIFYFTIFILAISTLINLIIGPAYFFYMAEGRLNVLIKLHLILGVSNAVFAFILGYFWGGNGVVYGWFCAIVLSSMYLLNVFNKSFSLSYQDLFEYKNVIYSVLMIFLVLLNSLHVIKGDFRIIDSAFLAIAMILPMAMVISKKVELF